MRTKQDIVNDIVAAGGQELNPNDYTAAELEAKLKELTDAKALAEAQNISPAAATVQLQYSEPDDDGHRWKEEKEGKQTRLFLITKEGRAYNALVDDTTKGKDVLKRLAEARKG